MEQYVKGFQRFHTGEDVQPVTSCKFLLIRMEEFVYCSKESGLDKERRGYLQQENMRVLSTWYGRFCGPSSKIN